MLQVRRTYVFPRRCMLMFLKPDTSRHGDNLLRPLAAYNNGVCKHHNALCIRGSVSSSVPNADQPFRFTPTDVSISSGMAIQAHFYTYDVCMYIILWEGLRTTKSNSYCTLLTPIDSRCWRACVVSSSCADVGRCVSRTARAVAGATRRCRSGRDGLSGVPNGHCFCFLQLGRARRLQQVCLLHVHAHA